MGLCLGAFLAAARSAPPVKEIKLNHDDLKQLVPEYKVWVDAKQKFVVMQGEVCLTKGFLEMFCCPKGTKEHESIVSVKTEAKIVHAALLAVGAVSGTTVQFRPEYKSATGQVIEVYVLWNDKDGAPKQTLAQNWIRDVKTNKAMSVPWVFAGSGFWEDDDGKKHYRAESGDFICVSNFPGAMMDLPIQSTDQNNELNFEAFTERIPPKGTEVKIVLVPKLTADKKPVMEPASAAQPATDKTDATKPPASKATAAPDSVKPDASKPKADK
jgi:hypothetical protein